MDQFPTFSWSFFFPACTDGLNKCRCIVAVIFVSLGKKACLLVHLSTQHSPISMAINDLVGVFFCCPGARNQFVETWQTVSLAANQRSKQSCGILTMPYFNERHLQHVSVHRLIWMKDILLAQGDGLILHHISRFATYIGYTGLLVSCFDHTAP